MEKGVGKKLEKITKTRGVGAIEHSPMCNLRLVKGKIFGKDKYYLYHPVIKHNHLQNKSGDMQMSMSQAHNILLNRGKMLGL